MRKIKIKDGDWMPGIPDSLTLECGLCGIIPRFDYHVKTDVWNKLVNKKMRRGVICLPCFNELAKSHDIDLANCLTEVFFCDGRGESIELIPIVSYIYTPKD